MSKFIIYGAGSRGWRMLDFLKYIGLDDQVECFVDRRAAEIGHIGSKKVITFEESEKLGLPYVIEVIDSDVHAQIEEMLKQKGVVYYGDVRKYVQSMGYDVVKYNRDYCSYWHIDKMDKYFNDAEDDKRFWDGTYPSLRMFKNLDLSNVIELACGRGRHVPLYIESAGKVTLVDILQKNIDMCRERFKNYDNITYYCNNGTDLSELEDNTYSALFTYDSMVHFELLDIASYLEDIYRVIKPGGYALFHHSNNSSDYKASFGNAPCGRSFMSKDIFAHLAYRKGWEIVEQTLFDWNGIKNLDCLTLLRKPE